MQHESTSEYAMFRPFTTKKASESIYDQIRELILSGQLRPGDQLPPERKMMEMFQRSRPSVREALRMLEQDSLIKVNPGGGAVVMAPTTNSVEMPLENLLTLNCISKSELVEARTSVESSIAFYAAKRRSSEDIQEMEAALWDKSDSPDSFLAFSELDMKFHQSIANAAHNRLLNLLDEVMHNLVLKILSSTYEQLPPELQEKMMAQILDDHKKILEAIIDQDSETAQNRMLAHVHHFEVTIQEFIVEPSD